VCRFGGAGENEGGARGGHWSRDRGAEELSGTDRIHFGIPWHWPFLSLFHCYFKGVRCSFLSFFPAFRF